MWQPCSQGLGSFSLSEAWKLLSQIIESFSLRSLEVFALKSLEASNLEAWKLLSQKLGRFYPRSLETSLSDAWKFLSEKHESFSLKSGSFSPRSTCSLCSM